MYTFWYYFYTGVYFYSFVAIAACFLWDYRKVPGWLFVIGSLMCYPIVVSPVLREIASFLIPFPLHSGITFSFRCLFIAIIFIFLLVKAPLAVIVYTISIISMFGFFLAGIEFEFPTYGSYTYAFMLHSGILYFSVALILCILIRKYVVPLFIQIKSHGLWIRLTVPAISGAIGCCFLFYDSHQYQYPLSFYVGGILLFATCLISNLFHIQSIQFTLNANRIETQLVLSEKLRALQSENYAMLAKAVAEAKSARHDLRHQIRVFSTLLSQKDYSSLETYLKEYQIQDTSSWILYTGSASLDALLSHYLSLAEKNHIHVSYDNFQPLLHCAIKDTDLTIIFGNCMENAIEASQKIPETKRYLKISSSEQGDFFSLIFENAFDGVVKIKNNQLQSSKREYQTSGIGLLSVQHIVEEYQGEIELQYEQNVFKVLLLLQKKQVQKGESNNEYCNL